MDVTFNENIKYTTCEIASGVLRILFANVYLGTNISDSLANLINAINEVGTFSEDTFLNFNVRSSINLDYESMIDVVQIKYKNILAIPTWNIEPNLSITTLRF